MPPAKPPLVLAVFFVHTQAMLEDYKVLAGFDKIVVSLEPHPTGLIVTFLDGEMILIPNAMLEACSKTLH